jgi:hypothetical protein
MPSNPETSLVLPLAGGEPPLFDRIARLASLDGGVELLVVGHVPIDERAIPPSIPAAGIRIALLASPGGSGAALRNLVLSRARGELLGLLDPDSEPDLEAITFARRLLVSDPSLSFAAGVAARGPRRLGTRPPLRADLAELLVRDPFPAATLFRTRAVRETGGWNPDPALAGLEEWDLRVRILEGGGFARLSEIEGRPGEPESLEIPFEARQRLRRAHESSCQALALEVLAIEQELVARKTVESYRLERELAVSLDPLRYSLEGEIERLRATGAARVGNGAPPPARLIELERELAAARFEVRALRASWSWRITRPLRALGDLLLLLRGGGR